MENITLKTPIVKQWVGKAKVLTTYKTKQGEFYVVKYSRESENRFDLLRFFDLFGKVVVSQDLSEQTSEQLITYLLERIK